MKNLSTALVKFHSQFKPIKKDAQNPFFKSDYLTLSGILDAVRAPLSANGLAIIQSMRVDNSNTILITKLIHESGEELISEMLMPVLNDPQKMGSLITYYKRYQLQALLGISTADEDDDANMVSTQPKVEKVNTKSEPATPPQIKLLTSMGIYFSKDITKSEASKLIENNQRVRK